MPIEDRKGIWQMRFQVEGKPVHKSTRLKATERNRKKAEAIEVKEREALIMERRFNIRRWENKSFAEAAPDFLKWLKAEYPKPSTFEAYHVAFGHSLHFFKDRFVSSVTDGDIEEFKVDRLTVTKPSTANTALVVLSKFFAYCKKRNWCSGNPTEAVSRPSTSGNGRTRVLSYDEEKRYFRAVKKKDHDLHDFVVVLLNHGLRPDEALSLRKEDVNLELGRFAIQHGKTPSARRTVKLTPETLPIFERRMENASDWLFPRPHDPDKYIAIESIRARHARVLKRAKLDFLFYDCRHTFATRLLETGASTLAVARLLGHANLATVAKYLHPGDSMLTDAMEAYSANRQLKLAS